jgi:hypothetical protein
VSRELKDLRRTNEQTVGSFVIDMFAKVISYDELSRLVAAAFLFSQIWFRPRGEQMPLQPEFEASLGLALGAFLERSPKPLPEQQHWSWIQFPVTQLELPVEFRPLFQLSPRAPSKHTANGCWERSLSNVRVSEPE